MPLTALLVAILISSLPAPPESDIVVIGHPVPPFISPMGEPFRGHVGGKDAFVDWFRQADRNRDGLLTLDELQADAERFFAKLDLNHDGQIDPDELVQYEWEIAPEIQVNTKLRRARSASQSVDERGHEGRHRSRNRDEAYDPDGLQGAARYALLNMPEPVAAADADLNRVVSLSEFRRAAIDRFQLLDSRRQGKLTLQELEARLPKLPPLGKRPKRDTDKADTRVGVPLPPAR